MNFGFNPESELLNGRLAMLAFVAVVVIEMVTGTSFLELMGLM